MVACFLAGAAVVVGIIAFVWLIKYLKIRKKVKKGVAAVSAIAPLPARPTVFAPRRNSNVLSFV